MWQKLEELIRFEVRVGFERSNGGFAVLSSAAQL